MRHLLLVFLLVLAALPAGAQVQGYVDLHSHLMAEYSFAGAWFHGTAEGPINPAVARCDGNIGFLVPPFFRWGSHASTRYGVLSELVPGGDVGLHLGNRRGYDNRRCKRIRIGWITIIIPGTCPKPHWEGWPRWDTTAHQQMWHEWLKDAHRGGLRVMVVSLAESNFLCDSMPIHLRRYNCDEMQSVERQAQKAWEYVGRNASWVGIARTAAEARSLIAQGKLALVLAAEITKLFPEGDFLAQLDRWRNLGIRSVQVAHHADNRFAGAAPIGELIRTAKRIEALNLGQNLTDIDDIVCADANGDTGNCTGIGRLNIQGLTNEGRTLVRAMMDRGMLLDVSHVSRKSFREIYEIALPRDYPLIYSHVHTHETIAEHEPRNEKFLTAEEIHQITDTGGMIGLRTGFEDTVQYWGPNGGVINWCQGSSRSFAQSLMYAVDHGLDVGFGADLNGFIKQMKPRNDNRNCWIDSVLIGDGTWFQNKGLGHVGLLPELMADLREIGVPQLYLDHLNQSAETFLRIWERSENLAVPIPTNLARSAATAASSSYTPGCGAPGPHCYSPQRINDGSRSTALGGLDSWTNDNGQPMPQWVWLQWAAPVTFSRVDVFLTAGFVASRFDVEYFDETTASWRNVGSVSNNTLTSLTFNLPGPAQTRWIRLVGWSGPAHQPGYVRVNEIEVY